MAITLDSLALLRLLQLASPALPVGAYSYSEGLENLIHRGAIATGIDLKQWLTQELNYGAIRLEAAVLLRVHRASQNQDLEALNYWNNWLSAARETEELRHQSWQMGRSLLRLAQAWYPDGSMIQACGSPCNFATIFGVLAVMGNIDEATAVLGYLHSWATNLLGAGVKLIPLGQTEGQQHLLALNATLEQACQDILGLSDADLGSWGWGLALASMAHEVQYSRLFQS